MSDKFDFRSFAYFEQQPSGSPTNDLLSNEQIGEGAGAGVDDADELLFRETENYIHKNERFALSRHVTEFILNANSAEPDEKLRDAFDKIIKRAIKNTEDESGNKVVKFGVFVSGRGLNDPIVLPARPFPQNSADVLMAELEKLGQSDDDEEGTDKRSLLLSEPVQIVITCIAPPTGGAYRFHPYNFYGVNARHRIIIRNNDRFCMFHALIATKRYHDRHLIAEMKKRGTWAAGTNLMDKDAFNRLLNNKLRMTEAVHELMDLAGIPNHLDRYGIEHLKMVQEYWDRMEPGLYRIFFFHEEAEEPGKPIWKGEGTGRRFDIAIYLQEGHYDGIKKINCFFGVGRKYCGECELFYSCDQKHQATCAIRCYNCGKCGPGFPCAREDGVKIHCEGCNRNFYSASCFESHQQQMCNLWKKCGGMCGKVYRYDAKKPHKCYSIYCRRCGVHHNKKAGCFIKKVPIPEEKQKYRMVIWDSESSQDVVLREGEKRHVVNYISARITCTECIDEGERDDCEICMTQDGKLDRMKDWSEAEGDNPVRDFVEWILRAWKSKYKTYIWAHNLGRYDGHFILQYMGETGKQPKVIMNGLKIYEFSIQRNKKHSQLIWRDSYLLLPVRLADLKPTFNLSCEDKPFFPYLYNKRENYGTRLNRLPPIDDYCTGSMKEKQHDVFQKWYDENWNTPFNLNEELRQYCRNDTEILLKSVVEFRRILTTEITSGFDVLPLSCTIASACMTIFRALFLKDEQLALVPERGYERNDRSSVEAIKYLDWRSVNDGVEIRHAGNGTEMRYKGLKLDGWIESQRKCIEYLGCYWHGCLRCFPPDAKLVDEKTAKELNETTYERLRKLREPDEQGNGIEVEENWECEVNAELGRNKKMQEFYRDLSQEKGPIDPRLAYYGGRTGPLKLYAKPMDDEKISVYDIISLYPWVNYATLYPCGIPDIIVPRPEETVVNWAVPEDLQYKGIYRVRVIPPKGLRIPVLPMKVDDRLLFALCHRCATKFRKAGTKCRHVCTHSEAERAYTMNYTHLELEKALEYGYKIDRFWRAWHYKEWSDQIFKDYVRLLLKLKVESSGFPDDVQTEEDKQAFVEEYKDVYDVIFDDFSRIRKNPGLRFISKIMLNSLWGKFSMRNTLCHNKIITNPQDFYKLVFNHEVEISAAINISDKAIRVLYRNKSDFVSEHRASNIVISLWTTSVARLKLLDYMMQIEKNPLAWLLYTDTDSASVLHKKGCIPLETGKFLGQMSEEFANSEIVEFVCGGKIIILISGCYCFPLFSCAKQYAYKLNDKRTGDVNYLQKIRGITFDVANAKALQYESFKEKVLNYGKDGQLPAVFRYKKIRPLCDNTIITQEMAKKYLPICQKGIINDQYDVFPFGFE